MEVKVNSKDLHQALEDLMNQLPDQGATEPLFGFFQKLRIFLARFEVLDQGSMEEVIHSLEEEADIPLFSEVGHLLRRFHDQMQSISSGLPQALANLDPDEVGSFSDKLSHILEMTDRAANKTMDLAEAALAVLAEEQSVLDSLTQNPVIAANEDAMAALGQLLKNNQAQNNRMTEVLMAQDYQDLTGQLINKVMALLKHLESDLIELVTRFGSKKIATPQSEVRLNGPMHESHEERQNQDNVDSLLSQFGF